MPMREIDESGGIIIQTRYASAIERSILDKYIYICIMHKSILPIPVHT